jgi:L,D-transpeptidase ErfK/SrfK
LPPNSPNGRFVSTTLQPNGLNRRGRPKNSIGLAASHGCIRMANADVEQLFKIVPVGTPVRIF